MNNPEAYGDRYPGFTPARLKRARERKAKLEAQRAHCFNDPLLRCLVPGYDADIKMSERAIARIEASLGPI